LNLEPVIDEQQFVKIKDTIAGIFVDDKIINYITEITNATRDYPGIEVGASPRGSVALLQTSRVKAAVEGRDFVIPDDVKYLAFPVLRHRLILEPEAEIEGFSADDYLKKIIEKIKVPR
jgi:MoxR-like ATPase